MGCFDEFYFEQPIYCYKCGIEISSMQSRSLNNDCRIYKVGDKYPGHKNTIVNEEIVCDNYCEGIHWDIIIEDGIFKGIIKSNDYNIELTYDKEEYKLY